jgi:hypothetical protein
MKRVIVLAAICLLTVKGMSQSMGSTYKTALGVKVLDGAGISLKHFTSPNIALEAIGFFWNRGTRITGLYEIHGDINGAPGLKYYIGPGAHVGFYNKNFNYNNKMGGTFLGVDGVLGLDYKIKGAPINMSLDWQPSFEFGDGQGFVGSWGGFAVRYTF